MRNDRRTRYAVYILRSSVVGISRAQKVTCSEVSDTPQAEGPRLFSPELQSSALNSVLSQRKNFILQPSPLSHAQKLFLRKRKPSAVREQK